MYSIAFISVERLLAVCWPHKHRMLKLWHYVLAISLTWIVAATVALESNEILPDRISSLEGHNVRTIFAIIPIIVTVAAYSLLWLNKKGHEAKNHKEKNNKRIACTLFVVTTIFFCTWSPFIILISILGYVCSLDRDTCHSLVARNSILFALHFTKLLQYSNSSVNPFIYALRIHSFRDKVLKILCCSKIGKRRFTISRETSSKTTSCDGNMEMRSFSDTNAAIKGGGEMSDETNQPADDQQP